MALYEEIHATVLDLDPAAEFEIKARLVALPSGRFTLPLCINAEELLELLSELNRARSWSSVRLNKARDVVLQALPYANRSNPLCDCGCSSDCEDCDG